MNKGKQKIKIFDKNLMKKNYLFLSIVSTIFTLGLAFINIPQEYKKYSGYFFIILCISVYLWMWYKANTIQTIEFRINQTLIEVKEGDIFEEEGLKVIGFNEYFDTHVGDNIISRGTLNGQYISKNIYNKEGQSLSLTEFNDLIKTELHEYSLKENKERNVGKERNIRKEIIYPLGTILKRNDYLLTALSKFDKYDNARLTVKEYLEFLLNFWMQIEKYHDNEEIILPLLASSSLVRFDKHKFSDQELLELLVWSFNMSKIKLKKLKIIIYKDNFEQINLFEIKSHY